MNNEQVQLHTLVAKLSEESEITKLMISWTLKVVSFRKFWNIQSCFIVYTMCSLKVDFFRFLLYFQMFYIVEKG